MFKRYYCFICRRSSEKGKFVDLTHSPSIHQTPEALTKWGLHYIHRWRLALPRPRALSNCLYAPLPLILRPKEFRLVFDFSPVWLHQPAGVGQFIVRHFFMIIIIYKYFWLILIWGGTEKIKGKLWINGKLGKIRKMRSGNNMPGLPGVLPSLTTVHDNLAKYNTYCMLGSFDNCW